jgi:hypothetical protein
VQEVNKSPENYALDKITETERIQSDDQFNDTSSWGSSEFEDEMIEESKSNDTQEIVKTNLIRDKQVPFLQNNRISSSGSISRYSPKEVEEEEEEIYINCESFISQDEQKNSYKNCKEAKLPLKNVSKLHGHAENSLANKLKEELEELKRRNQDQAMKKPMIGPKPETLSPKKIPMTDKKLPQKSFLHDASKTHEHVPNTPIEQNKTRS